MSEIYYIMIKEIHIVQTQNVSPILKNAAGDEQKFLYNSFQLIPETDSIVLISVPLLSGINWSDYWHSVSLNKKENITWSSTVYWEK